MKNGIFTIRIVLKVIIILSIILTQISCQKNEQKKGEGFWNGTQYEMELNQVKKLFPNGVTPTNPGTLNNGASILYMLNNYVYLGETFDVSFFFINEKLTQITLSLKSGFSKETGNNIFSKLKENITKNYGEETNSDDVLLMSNWILSDKTIRLAYLFADTSDRDIRIVFQK